MRIDIATLFPDMCETVLNESIVGRARKAEKIELHCHQIRDYSNDKHRRVDDTPYGGGMGMVMQAEPIYEAYMSICKKLDYKPYTIYMSPQGKSFRQSTAKMTNKDAPPTPGTGIRFCFFMEAPPATRCGRTQEDLL